ncbi:MAG: polyhydroxyalkanoate synthesis repressor PhaR [Polaromonas sp.]|jgi:polyhydroxyalkanoate synthesis repressor PhaR|nr:polyhydroxyalkanoate synthesis repressor PhaR [Polaromonas sp.]MBK9341275.1 polyhydroxyalkanoate synthesis repressor PhaR [Rhodoferax sp.]MBP6089591.1 polyhydroxyalkanoate synthesis repressor PhaR [Polaromonas sp.]MBP6157394.1 polyhydroxyalkanoate synthesis repressor PhaR [Polaromonas sp.]MBP7116686.1 polyhydroxyalkanoate synthesis repressor PhaR [Polaromonas sp.]
MTPSKPSTSKTPKLSVKSSVRSTAKSSAKAAAQPSDNVSEAATAASSHTSVFNKNVRVIKKYPNRRLYDTTTSSYITLADIKALVMKNAPFVVRDAKTDEDLTRSMLLQIILEAEAGGAPMFTEAVLANIIRFYGHAMQGFVGNYLEKNMQTFTDLQANMGKQSADLTPEAWTKFMQQGVMGTYMQQMQKQTEQMLGMFGLKK